MSQNNFSYIQSQDCRKKKEKKTEHRHEILFKRFWYPETFNGNDSKPLTIVYLTQPHTFKKTQTEQQQKEQFSGVRKSEKKKKIPIAKVHVFFMCVHSPLWKKTQNETITLSDIPNMYQLSEYQHSSWSSFFFPLIKMS